MPEKPYLSIEDVAKSFGVTPTTIYRLVQKGELPGFKIGSQWRFSQDMLEAWVADQVTVERLKSEDGQPPSRMRSSKRKAS